MTYIPRSFSDTEAAHFIDANLGQPYSRIQTFLCSVSLDKYRGAKMFCLVRFSHRKSGFVVLIFGLFFGIHAGCASTSGSGANKSANQKLKGEDKAEKQSSSTRSRIAKNFAEHMLNTRPSEAWELTGDEFRKNTSQSELKQMSGRLDKMTNRLLEDGSVKVEEVMSGMQTTPRGKFPRHAFRLRNSVTEKPQLIINVYFEPNTQQVHKFTIQTRINKGESETKTSRAAEHSIAKDLTWAISGEKYQIKKIMLIEFSETGMLGFTVVQQFSPDTIDKPTARRLVRAVAERIVREGYIEKARKLAKREGLKFSKKLGAALLHPKKSGGYRVKFRLEDLR